MGKSGRSLFDLASSGDPEDQFALTFSDSAFKLAAKFQNARTEHAPLGFFKLSPDDPFRKPFDYFLWRSCVRLLGPWVNRGVAKAMIDPDAKFDMETRVRYAVALELCGHKDQPTKARDVILTLGMAALISRDVAISGREPKTSNLRDGDRYAAHKALEYGVGNITVSAVEKVWKARSRKLTAVLANEDGTTPKDIEELCRTILKF